MTATMKLRGRCASRRRAIRQRGRRWDMAWTAPPYWSLVGQGVVVATLAGAIGGALVTTVTLNPIIVVVGAVFGAHLALLGSLVVAPVVALVLRGAQARSIRIALRRARLAAVTTTFVLFQILLPVAVQGRPAGFHEVYAIGVAVACVAAWCAARHLVIVAVRKTRQESDT
jgi:hypothetical protein